MDKLMIIMRGVPGSGKSTIAKILQKGLPNSVICSTDDFFETVEGYSYDPSKLQENHQLNQEKALIAMQKGMNLIIDNTNLHVRWMFPYLDLAEQFGYIVSQVTILEDQETAFKRNKHGLPEHKHKLMHDQLIKSIQIEFGNPIEDPPEDYLNH